MAIQDSGLMEVIDQIFWSEVDGINPINQFILLIIEAALVFIPGIILLKKGKITYKRLLHIFFLLAYMGIVLSITIFRRARGSREGIVHLGVKLGFGIRTGQPSKWIGTFSFFNILLFVPLGALIFLFFKEKEVLKSVCLTTVIGMVISLMVEITQLFSGRGMFEVSDILTNTAGSLIGALIAFFIVERRKRKIV